MAAREFTITELKRTSNGTYASAKVFTWTAAEMSAPRGSWNFGVDLRTVRTDYPGTDEPVEQVLGPNYSDFELTGIWDDRYNSPGFAVETMRAMEDLVKRGPLVKLAFETVSIKGLIKSIRFDYTRANYIGWALTFSAHARVDGSGNRPGLGSRREPDALTPATVWRDYVSRHVGSLTQTYSALPFLPTQMTGATVQDTGLSLADMQTQVAQIVTAVDQRITATTEEYEGLRRVAAGMAVLKGQAIQLMFDLNGLRSDTALAWESAVGVLDFEAWQRDLRTTARALALSSHRANDEITRRVEPKAIAVYRPQQGESLYAISQRFYGTPHQWRLISDRNGLVTLTLQGTELLIIPDRR